ncbi:pentatricopeptide repeat-containing protein At2g17033-like, partial [Triticum dicoccoides]|uniref:pentatricopeptide repeat-containing protein At2g17033-like n=1 Tax=Triticum dicoccoides TaxID=85692 RepID=UPI00188E8823
MLRPVKGTGKRARRSKIRWGKSGSEYQIVTHSLSQIGSEGKGDEIWACATLTSGPVPTGHRAPTHSSTASTTDDVGVTGLAAEAEEALKEMVSLGYQPDAFQFGLVAKCYGKAGQLAEMERVIASMSDAGIRLGTGAANIVLSCYSACRDHGKMLAWLKKMRKLRVAPTTKAYNFVLNSCPTVVSMARQLDPSLPLSAAQLVRKLKSASPWPAEAEVVQELLAASSVLNKAMVWSETEVKLNLHGFSITSTYVLMLQWVDSVKVSRTLPLEVSVVCGVGKHSDVRGEPKVRELAQEVLSRMGSPLQLSVRNKGRLMAKRDRLKQCLATEWTSVVPEESTDQSPNASDQHP